MGAEDLSTARALRVARLKRLSGMSAGFDVIAAIQIPSFRGDAKHRTRNLEIPGLALTRHPGIRNGRLSEFAP
jgi:hypothetical protein